MSKKAFGVLQQVGKALMLPVALLPAAGILLALGSTFQTEQFLNMAPMFGADWVQFIAQLMASCGGVIFDNLPLLFAVGVAVGLAGGEGVAGIAAIVGFLIMNKTIGIIAGVTPEMVSEPAYASVLGIPTLQSGVFGGIIMGIIAAQIYKKYYNIELPPYLGFFAGKRFVPIMTAVVSIFVGVVMTFVWPHIQGGLTAFSSSMIDANQTLSAFVFGVIERALIPFGLHHIFYNPFWFQFGEWTNSAGQVINGDFNIFMAQLGEGVKFTAGTFMTGKFPFMMFGLPAAALAMYHEAKEDKKKMAAGILMSAALTSFLTGITEPLEFAFLFIAPALYAIHCVFAGLSFMLMQLLNVKIGMTFSGGVIDYLIFGVLQNRTPWWLVIPVGLGFSVIYYFMFRFAIRKWNLKTPGREDDDDVVSESGSVQGAELAAAILKALGGKENISKLDACITRLRISVNDIKNVDKEELKRLGAAGVLEVGNNIQAIFGPKSDTLMTQMKDIMAGKISVQATEKVTLDKEPAQNIESQCTLITDEEFVSPLSGKVVELKDVPDQVFSQKMMGDGFAIEPVDGKVVSPVDGTIVTLFNTKHAIGIKTDKGAEILIHVGIDTVNLKGEGFKEFVNQGDKVKAGQKLLEVDIDSVSKKVPSMITPVIFTNLTEGTNINVKVGKEVKCGDKNIVNIK